LLLRCIVRVDIANVDIRLGEGNFDADIGKRIEDCHREVGAHPDGLADVVNEDAQDEIEA
jgi:hypothetical protein